ncbi:MAG: DUF6261 family protein, partial [Tannerella sp.]|jgi:hypothetical protein|nr:DUF6261 family protein [Tannerella sp.]
MKKLKFISLVTGKFKLENLAGIVVETLHEVAAVILLLGENGVRIVNRLTADVTTMMTEMDRSQRSPLTEPIREANKMCDATINDIKRTVKAGEQSANATRAAAGKSLGFALEGFWHLDRKPQLTQIVVTNELLERYHADVKIQADAKALGIDDLFALLAVQNSHFDALCNQRTAKSAGAAPAASTMRNTVAVGYDDLCTLVVRTVNLDPVDPALLTAFHAMNSIRRKYAALRPSKIDIALAVTEPVGNRIYTGKPITFIPVARYGDKLLTLGKDFALTFHNNVEAGEGRVILHGKGRFTGQHERAFNIVYGLGSEG